MNTHLSFACDYMEGTHPAILQKLVETNLEKTGGYGLDPYCDAAKEKIKAACGCPEGEVFFLVGGTQTNATVIDALLKSYQGVIAAEIGHVSVHEAGAIEADGHKVLTLPHDNGKISADQVRGLLDGFYNDANHDHMVMPGMVYISHPTEYGTLYTLEELTELSNVCHENHIPLYMDGARLAYALVYAFLISQKRILQCCIFLLQFLDDLIQTQKCFFQCPFFFFLFCTFCLFCHLYTSPASCLSF